MGNKMSDFATGLEVTRYLFRATHFNQTDFRGTRSNRREKEFDQEDEAQEEPTRERPKGKEKKGETKQIGEKKTKTKKPTMTTGGPPATVAGPTMMVELRISCQ